MLVSRQTQPRTPRRPIVPATGPRARAVALDPAQQAVIDAARQLPQLADPLDVEVAISASVGPLPAGREPWDVVIEHAVAVPSRRSLALLRALAALLPEPVAGLARDEADRITGVPEPVWGQRITRLTAGECWIADQAAGAGHRTLLCTYAYDHEEHAGVFLVDAVRSGAVRNAFVTRDVASATEMLATEVPLSPLDPVDAHTLLAAAYDRVDTGADRGIDPDVHVVRLLTRRRIAHVLG